MMMTYIEAVSLLQTARSPENGKPLENNTRLFRLPNSHMAIRLHETDVVTISPDNVYTLNTGGWRTVTTKDRINRYSPAQVWQRNKIWYIADGPDELFFEEGMQVSLSERDDTGCSPRSVAHGSGNGSRPHPSRASPDILGGVAEWLAVGSDSTKRSVATVARAQA